MAYIKKLSHLPPDCGADLNEPLLFNPYQQAFQQARRMRFCLNCRYIDPKTKCSGFTANTGLFTCPKCGMHHLSNLTAPRLFDRLLALAGRGGGKTLIGAHAAREEMLVPNGIGWVMGATHKILHDSTFPTLVRRIPPDWVKKWDADNMEITLKNNHLIAFRSLQDNPDRARGPHGVGWGWFDEAAQCPERAYDVFEPCLIKAGGIVIATTTVLGYDWSYDKIEKPAQRQEPGFFAIRWWSEENPLFASNPVMKAKIERAKLTMTEEFYAQEYKAERRNAEGLVYNYTKIETLVLEDAKDSGDCVREHIPEWPDIDASRPILIGLDSGADHPFGAAMGVVTPTGIVWVNEYLNRMKALSEHRKLITQAFNTSRYSNVTWAANRNEANLRLEWGLEPYNIHIAQAEAKHEIGIQRVQEWLLTERTYFVRSRVPLTIEQLQAYRYQDNTTTSGEKTNKEQVFKKKDELPDAIRYAFMVWPELPQPKDEAQTVREKARWSAMDERTRLDVTRQREYARRQQEKDMSEKEDGYPLGSFFGGPEREW